ncbi:transcriptional repressor LexA [Clostridium sporogenes]|uniref:transcriptional repressor LexA n=1 Tax=Clostridium sporogenes TaxID=1509 RepID=UPI003F91CD81
MENQKSTNQKKIYRFIKQYINNKGYSPSIREICVGVGFKSPSSVLSYLKALEKKGFIKREPTKTRTIKIIEDKKELMNIPILKTALNSSCLLSSENIEGTFPIPIDFIKKTNGKLFMVKVKGDAMVDFSLLDGDFAIIEKTNCIKNGDIVACIFKNEFIIRRLFKTDRYILLKAESTSVKPIVVNDCKIIGKLIGHYRSY